ncbi:remorin 4.2-like [Primulina huaijiensis]|uniref:remorin 4.2-like n=1 Tax=Primulina huaijiensis TaxID=1492673 RepID=UPI003CC72A60
MLNNEIRTIFTSNPTPNSNIRETPSIRDIHALTPSPREPWETNSRRLSSYLSTESSSNYSDARDNRSFARISSDQFSALVTVGSTEPELSPSYRSIGEDGLTHEESTNPLAIMLTGTHERDHGNIRNNGEASARSVKKEEVECKINAWQNAEISKINNRFKREIAVIKGLEGEQVEKATLWMKKVERKLEEKRAKALEKMQNDMAKAQRKAEETRASAEAKRGMQAAKVLEIANLMRVVGRPPVKRSFF